VPNIASRVPRTASHALNNIFVPILLEAGENGGIEQLIIRNPSLRQGVYLYNGTVTNMAVSRSFNLPFQDIDLLMAAFH
jgi:alanine dehydrogenase